MNHFSNLRFELQAFTNHRYLWLHYAYQDIKQRYRRSIVGPFWITISTAIFVTALSQVYSRLFKISLNGYFPYLAAGLIIWTFITTALNEAANSLISVENVIKQVRIPFTSHIMRSLYRNFLIFLHSWVVLFPVLYLFGTLNVSGIIYSFLGMAILLLTLFPLSMLLAISCLRYRDILPMVSALLQLLFFVTPVMWRVEQVPSLLKYMAWNPFYYMISMVRDPLLSDHFPVSSFVVTASIGAVAWLFAIVILMRTYKKIAYWL
ncbi:ABC transporter permease [Robbsia sp. Bb-Pol-6]|uniref:Transport permease protein n=1 Tax=Robbsia betulipollinis TaxID=2981849 RepID=A0ABT3ZLZ1_9BURK|nr:ABC transporter permease [Robbsia betulipollinis]MCY0387549.1 ABC transporter permease [Robbsia betulipollinis]